MILAQQIPAIRSILTNAAKSRTAVSFAKLFSLFPEDARPDDVYDTLEAACYEIATWNEAIFSVLMAKKHTGLPGDGFFDIYRIHRATEYMRIAGRLYVFELSDSQKIEMTERERENVFAYSDIYEN